MVKILSQGGRSLADMYQVAGSIAGIDSLETRELPIVHEMGAVLFSERFRTTIRRVATGDMAQNTTASPAITTMPASITRIVGIQVYSDDESRVLAAAVSLQAPDNTQDFPIWVWDGTAFAAAPIVDDGVLLTLDVLGAEPGSLMIPSFTGGVDQGSVPVTDLRLRVTSTGFGAGTVEVMCVVYLAFTFTGGVSAFGARVPSW